MGTQQRQTGRGKEERMKQWLVPHEGKLNKMVLVDGEKRPEHAYAEWPKGWHPLLAQVVEVKVPPGKVSINLGLLMQVAKKQPLLYSKAKETGLVFEVPEKGFFKKLMKRFKRK